MEQKQYVLNSTETITDSDLISVTVLRVTREGLGHNLTTGTAGNREFEHDATLGKLIFETASSGIEKVEVIING